MALIVTPKIREKLGNKTPPVTTYEIMQCFANLSGNVLLDTRADNQTNPPTRWFISETDFGRKLKVVYIADKVNIIIKTAYDPNPDEMRLYNRLG